MKQTIILLLLLLTLTSCGVNECETKECFDYKLEQSKMEAERLEKKRAYELEIKKVEAQIEANKPVAVKVQELKNEETTVGEGVATAAAIGGGLWFLGKAIDVATRY